MRDVNNGWLIRYTHANVASFFFIFVYAHIGRGIYYGSYLSPRVLVWSIGVIILVLMMAIFNIWPNCVIDFFFTDIVNKDLNLFNGSVLESLTAGIITQQRTFSSCSVVHMEKKEESTLRNNKLNVSSGLGKSATQSKGEIKNFNKDGFDLKVKISNSESLHLKKSFFSKNINSLIMSILTLLYLGTLLFSFMWIFKYNLIDLFQLIILSLFSFAVFVFRSDNYKFSNNKFIYLLQKILFYILYFALIVLVFGLIFFVVGNLSIFDPIFCGESEDGSSNNNEKSPKEKDVARVSENTQNDTYTVEVKKKIVDVALEKGAEIIAEGIKEVVPKLGVASAAGSAAKAAVKHTTGMAPLPRAIVVGSVTLATAAGTSIGIELGKAVTENTQKKGEIAASNLDKDGSNSPTEFDRGFINSVLEDNEIPLIVMVNGLSYLNFLEFSLVLSLFSLLFRKFLIRKLTDIIIKFIQKIKKTNKQKFQEIESIKDKDIDKNVSLNQAINSLDKYTDFLIVFIFICLF